MNIQRPNESTGFYYAGAVLAAATVLGGGTEQALWSDHLLQLLLLPSLIWGLGGIMRSRLSVPAIALAGIVLLIAGLQFFPVYRSLAFEGSLAGPGWGMWSPAPGRSLESVLFVVTALGFFALVARLSDQSQIRLYRFLVIGLMVNLVAVALQLSFDAQTRVVGLLPFEITAGLFANENHLGTLIYLAIPFFAYRFLVRDSKPVVFIAITLVLTGMLFAIGSRAGMALAPAMSILSLLWFSARNVKPVLKLAVLVFAMAAVSYGVFAFGLYNSIDEEVRATFTRNTLTAISNYWLTGSGLGTFPLVYPAYEKSSELINVYANHAHNDFIEVFLETGIAGVLAIAAFLGLLLAYFARSKYAQAAFIAVLAILVHSLVDYPLRTEAIAVIFAYCSAVILSTRRTGETEAESPVELVAKHSSRRAR